MTRQTTTFGVGSKGGRGFGFVSGGFLTLATLTELGHITTCL